MEAPPDILMESELWLTCRITSSVDASTPTESGNALLPFCCLLYHYITEFVRNYQVNKDITYSSLYSPNYFMDKPFFRFGYACLR